MKDQNVRLPNKSYLTHSQGLLINHIDYMILIASCLPLPLYDMHVLYPAPSFPLPGPPNPLFPMSPDSPTTFTDWGQGQGQTQQGDEQGCVAAGIKL